jgi:NAD-dependent dihydropyrimidine dehydrogenase PreA subunit/TorA maturation chaperone TorD
MGLLRAELYSILAEAFSDPPEWLALPGCEWPLFSLANELGMSSPNARQAIEKIKAIAPELVRLRQERYQALFSGPGRPRFWLHESLFRSGKLFGVETREVAGIYNSVGLAIDGAELPDHASIELAFLAFAANQQEGLSPQVQAWAEIEQTFIRNHAGCWLPALGRELAAAGDEVYSPLGQLLVESFAIDRPAVKRSARLPNGLWVPVLVEKDQCSLCGFCVQVCPQRVLQIRENAAETVLLRSENVCSGCAKCVGICPAHVIKLGQLNTAAGNSKGRMVLRSSPRALCPKCGHPTVSQVELECVQGQIGNLPWVELCQECRYNLMEEVQ